MTTVVTEPGLYADIPEADYHADVVLAPELGHSLSVSGAKKLIPPSTPAHFDYERKNPPQKDAWDIGTVAHRLILGAGWPIWVVDAYDWRLKKHQDAKKAKRAEGLTVINRADLLAAARMARAVSRHPLASAILSEGKAEQSFYWIDPETGVTCRGRVDLLRDNAIVDVKTCADASPAGFARAAAQFRYDMQAANYSEGIEAVTGERLPFVFVCVEKEAPHLVACYQLDDFALERGSRDCAEARRIFAECESSGAWPAYSTDIETLSLPGWAK